MIAVAGNAKTTPPPLRVWMRAVRIFSFTAAIAPVLIGSAFALVDRTFSIMLFPLILIACVLVQAGCNLANDYFDHQRGIDDATSIGIGGVIQAGWLSAEQVRNGMLVCFGLATLLGVILLASSTWWLLVLAIPSLLAAYLYTGGPRPLGYLALGQVMVWLFMGMGIVCGTYVAMAERLTWEVAVGSLGISALVAAILHVNDVRDFDSDRAAGKRTLAHLLGKAKAVREHVALIEAAYVFTALLIVIWPSNWPVLVVAASLPAAIAMIQLVRRNSDSQSLDLGVRGTASLHFQFGILTTFGLLIRSVIDRLG